MILLFPNVALFNICFSRWTGWRSRWLCPRPWPPLSAPRRTRSWPGARSSRGSGPTSRRRISRYNKFSLPQCWGLWHFGADPHLWLIYPDPTPDPTPFLSDFKDAKKKKKKFLFFFFFSYNLPTCIFHFKKFNFLQIFCVKISIFSSIISEKGRIRIRILEAQKHPDPDPQRCSVVFSTDNDIPYR